MAVPVVHSFSGLMKLVLTIQEAVTTGIGTCRFMVNEPRHYNLSSGFPTRSYTNLAVES